MRILLTGRNGQLGSELARALRKLGMVIATDRGELDLGDPDAIREVVRRSRPNIIVNAAAYTDVDKSESDSERAMSINGIAPGILAEEAARADSLFVHYSTDYVFDGSKRSPYLESDFPRPLNSYGRSKLAGEEAVRSCAGRYLVLRTSWLYGTQGKNFIEAILSRARRGDFLRVVNDQTGAPTWSRVVAGATASIIARAPSDIRGTYHISAAGETTWHDFAKEILTFYRLDASLTPISSEVFAALAKRPSYSVLDCAKLRNDFNLQLEHWRAPLTECLKERV